MKRLALTLGLIVFSALAVSACSSDGVGCKSDTDCPGTQRCLDGACGYEVHDPCREVTCPTGQVCRDGDCYDMNLDQDQDGYPIVVDCDDDNPDIHPGAAERCNDLDDDCDGLTDEDILCGKGCQQAQQNPGLSPPAECNGETPCEQCYNFEGVAYYCLSLKGAPHAFVAHPQATPCDPTHQCETLRCAESAWHCDGALQLWIPGDVPNDKPERCNNIDDDCDGMVDGPAAAADCPAPSHGTARCEAGSCSFDCETGYHACGVRCLDSTSPESCGDRCEPCPAPDKAEATCVAGSCSFTCLSGYRPSGQACIACDDNEHCGADCQPCPGNLDCCDGMCVNLSNDPLHCGACDTPCPSSSDICCPNTVCCDSDHPNCCGLYCCSALAKCCPGDFCCAAEGSCCDDHCCNPPYSVCCGTGCCPDAHPICWGQYCCDPTDVLCAGETGCCPPSYPVCCGDGSCCVPDSVCCSNIDGCCPTSAPVCCPSASGGFCCPTGTYCCGESCCAY